MYMVRCADDTLYTGVATNVIRRVKEHNDAKKGARYTRAKQPVALVYTERAASRSEALKREYAIKRLSRTEKLALIRHSPAPDILPRMKTATFKDRIYTLARQIPKGKVATYGQLAALAGNPGAARAVGGAMRTNPDIPATPCHRVVASNGALTGYSAGKGVSSKKKMLLQEGVSFKGDKVDLATSLWSGAKAKKR